MSFLSKIQALFSAKPELPSAEWLVVGLGNPGAQYETTRHNVGYMCVDMLIDAHSQPPLAPATGYKAHTTQLAPGVLAVRSTTFMNHSGQGVAPIAATLGIPPERIVVIHDELDLPAGKVRLKKGGNENGHNGLKSLTEELGTRDYLRIRIGISRPPAGMKVPDYVLEPVEDNHPGIKLASEAVDLIVSQGLPAAQNTIHSR